MRHVLEQSNTIVKQKGLFEAHREGESTWTELWSRLGLNDEISLDGLSILARSLGPQQDCVARVQGQVSVVPIELLEGYKSDHERPSEKTSIQFDILQLVSHVDTGSLFSTDVTPEGHWSWKPDDLGEYSVKIEQLYRERQVQALHDAEGIW